MCAQGYRWRSPDGRFASRGNWLAFRQARSMHSQVWGTHPYASLSYRWTAELRATESSKPRSGCEPGLYWGARQWLLFTYCMGGVVLLCVGGISVWAACVALHKERAMRATLRVASESLGAAEQGGLTASEQSAAMPHAATDTTRAPPPKSTTPLLKACTANI